MGEGVGGEVLGKGGRWGIDDVGEGWGGGWEGYGNGWGKDGEVERGEEV